MIGVLKIIEGMINFILIKLYVLKVILNIFRIYGSVQFDSVLNSGIINPSETAEKKLIAEAFKNILLGDSIFK